MSAQKRNPKTVAQKQRRAEARARRARQARAQARRQTALRVLGIAAVVAMVGGGFAWLVLDSRPAGPPEGVVEVDETERGHVEGEVDYANAPPAGGEHSAQWQTCGFYDEPIAEENAVHSLEHGAVWIKYAPDSDEATTQRIREIAGDEPYVLASPFPGLETPVAMSAWGRQLSLDSIDDPRAAQFVEAFVQGPQTPEPGATCRGGVGEPVG